MPCENGAQHSTAVYKRGIRFVKGLIGGRWERPTDKSQTRKRHFGVAPAGGLGRRDQDVFEAPLASLSFTARSDDNLSPSA